MRITMREIKIGNWIGTSGWVLFFTWEKGLLEFWIIINQSINQVMKYISNSLVKSEESHPFFGRWSVSSLTLNITSAIAIFYNQRNPVTCYYKHCPIGSPNHIHIWVQQFSSSIVGDWIGMTSTWSPQTMSKVVALSCHVAGEECLDIKGGIFHVASWGSHMMSSSTVLLDYSAKIEANLNYDE